MVRLIAAVGVFLTTSGCAFIDDFDYEFADDAAVPSDAGAASDGGARVDGGPGDGGPGDGGPADGGPGDGGSPCTRPCLADAVDEFSEAEQRAGTLEWEYLSNARDALGFDYVELSPDTIHDAPAWSDGSSAPAIVACGGSTTGACADAAGGLVFEADPPGDSRDPVLAFTAPADGTYELSLEAFSLADRPEVILGRNGRLDTVETTEVGASIPTRITGTLDLLAGERGLLTVRPSGTDPVTLATRARVLRAPGAPLEDCELALRFDDGLATDCAVYTVSRFEFSDETLAGTGPDGSGARTFPMGSALQVDGARFDFSEDFTVQMWVRIPRLGERQVIYSDWSAASPDNVGGVRIFYDTRRPGGSTEDALIAAFLFPAPATPPSGPGFVDCNDTRCRVDIVADLPSLGEWHFFRMTRRSASDEVRFCIDGELVGRGVLPGGVDISNPIDPTIGVGGPSNTPLFDGEIDDLRVFIRGLPCGD
jgi:hypothetical protein